LIDIGASPAKVIQIPSESDIIEENGSTLGFRDADLRMFYSILILFSLTYLLLMFYVKAGRVTDAQLFFSTARVALNTNHAFMGYLGGSNNNGSEVLVYVDRDGNRVAGEDEWIYMADSSSSSSRTLRTEMGTATVLSSNGDSAIISAFPRCVFAGDKFTFSFIIKNRNTHQSSHSVQIMANQTRLEEFTINLAPLEKRYLTRSFTSPSNQDWLQIRTHLFSSGSSAPQSLYFWMRVAPEGDTSCVVDGAPTITKV